MTFNEIEKEFDEKFVDTEIIVGFWKLDDKGTYYKPKHVKSLLKQSFIKYLQSEVDRHKARIADLKERQPHHTNDIVDYTQGSIETLVDEINNLQAQIKELESLSN